MNMNNEAVSLSAESRAGRLRAGGVLSMLLATGLMLAACAGAPSDNGGGTPPPGGGPPAGLDPREGDTCDISERRYEDDVTVPANVTCSFALVTFEGNLVISPGASVTVEGVRVEGNVELYTERDPFFWTVS